MLALSSCSISHGLAVSSAGSRSSWLSATCRNVVGVLVLSKVSCPAPTCEPFGVCSSGSRKVSSRFAETCVKSKDVAVSCESFRLSGTPARAPHAGCWEFDCQSVMLNMSECVELGVSESEEFPVGGPSRHLTLHLCYHCFPIVSKPFTAIFLYPMLLLHFRFDDFVNILEDHCLYPVWARGRRLALAGKKVFHAHDEVSIQAGTREHQVQGQAHLLQRPA